MREDCRCLNSKTFYPLNVRHRQESIISSAATLYPCCHTWNLKGWALQVEQGGKCSREIAQAEVARGEPHAATHIVWMLLQACKSTCGMDTEFKLDH